MRGLTYLERRALIVDPNSEGEFIPNVVFDSLIESGRGKWGDPTEGSFDGFYATEMGMLALRVCPSE